MKTTELIEETLASRHVPLAALSDEHLIQQTIRANILARRLQRAIEQRDDAYRLNNTNYDYGLELVEFIEDQNTANAELDAIE